VDYLWPGYVSAIGNTADDVRVPVPRAGTVTALYVHVITPDASNAAVFTVMKNGSPTTMVATVAATTTDGNDTTGGHAISVVAGDVLSIKVTGTGDVRKISASLLLAAA
jgi:hypothetical protein